MTRQRLALLLAVVVAVLSVPTPASAAVRIVDETRKGRVVTLTIATPAFSAPTKVAVDLPTGYDAQPSRRWPVTYVLAGTMNTYASFNSVVGGVALTKDFPSIVVSPNGLSGYWSDWFNNGAGGPPEYETYVVTQLIPLIDQHFRTNPVRAARAIAGVSMGGYGASMLAARHPDLFSSLASISGADDSNLPPLAAALSVSSTFDGGPPDAIYGPRLSQQVRWRGHNPVDLAANLRGLDVQVRTANGIPNPGIGEQLLSADSVSCVIEGGVHMGSVSFHEELTRLGIPHLWKDYGPGCHTAPNFKREISASLLVIAHRFAHPATSPSSFSYESIDPRFAVWGWRVRNDPQRALEFLRISGMSRKGLRLQGSGRVSLTTPPLFRGSRAVTLTGAQVRSVVPDSAGRIRFDVDLGPADTGQQYVLGTTTSSISRSVSFTPSPAAPATRPGSPGRGELPTTGIAGGAGALALLVLGTAALVRRRFA